MLTVAQVRAAKPRERPYKLYDTRGMYLHVAPNGTKAWRLKYRFRGREKLLALGLFPEVSLPAARRRRDDARGQVYDGIDPSEVRKAQKAAGRGSLEAIALEWIGVQSSRWTESTARQIEDRLASNVFPYLGKRPIADITAPDLLTVVRRIESRGAVESARRVLALCGQVFRFAVATGRADRDPTGDLRGALTTARTAHRAAITKPRELGALLRALETYDGTLVTRAAMRLLPLLFVRPGELRNMEWAEIDGDTWEIPAGKMKMRQPHVVPLARQATEIIEDLRPLTGNGRFVLASERSRDRPISGNTLNAVLRCLGFRKDQVSAHGFRATARTLLAEELHEKPELIEHQLAHLVRDPLGRAYNRTQFLAERRRMMQRWADYLDALRDGAQVIELHR